MIDLTYIRPLNEFQDNAEEHIERLKETGNPLVLTVNGKAEIIIQDAGSYEKLLERIERLEATAGIKRGLQEVGEGQTKPVTEVFESLRKQHKMDEF